MSLRLILAVVVQLKHFCISRQQLHTKAADLQVAVAEVALVVVGVAMEGVGAEEMPAEEVALGEADQVATGDIENV